MASQTDSDTTQVVSNTTYNTTFPISQKGTGVVLWRKLLKMVAKDAQIKQRFLSQKDVKAVSRVIFRKIARLLQEDIKGVSVPFFGRFVIRKSSGRYTIHPVSGDRTFVPPQKLVLFKPSDDLRRRMQKREHQRYQQGIKVRAMQKKVKRQGPWNVGTWDTTSTEKVQSEN